MHSFTTNLLLCPCSFPLLADPLLVGLAFEEDPPLICESLDTYPLVLNFLVALSDLLLELENFPLQVVLLRDGLS